MKKRDWRDFMGLHNPINLILWWLLVSGFIIGLIVIVVKLFIQ